MKSEIQRCWSRRAVFVVLGVGAMSMGLPSCSMNAPGGGIVSYQDYDRPTKLPKDPSEVRVKVSLSKQRTYVMEGDELLLVMPVSVGQPETPTPTGDFQIYRKEAKHRASHYGYAKKGDQIRQTGVSSRPAGWDFKGTPLPYWCEFQQDYGFHTGWIKHYPCTNGCIRMHENVAPKFFELVSDGTPVSIAYTQPEDAEHAQIPLPPDAGPLQDYDKSMYFSDGYFTRHKKPKFQ